MTGIESELISGIGKHLFIEKDLFKTFNLLKYYLKYNLLSKTFIYWYIARWYSEVNNKYMTDYDISKEIKFIVYLDANNFSLEMSQYLPYGRFKWFSPKKLVSLMSTQWLKIVLTVIF